MSAVWHVNVDSTRQMLCLEMLYLDILMNFVKAIFDQIVFPALELVVLDIGLPSEAARHRFPH